MVPHGLTQALKNNIERLALDLKGQPTHTTPAAMFWGRRHSFKVNLAGALRGSWNTFEGPKEYRRQGPLELIRRERGLSEVAAVEWAQSWLGGYYSAAPSNQKHSPKDLAAEIDRRDRKAIDTANGQWNSAGALTDTGRRYLASRGLPSIWSSAVVRELPRTFYPLDEKGKPAKPKVPALVVRAVAGVQLILLDPVTARKTPMGRDGADKVSLGRPGRGGAILQAGESGAPTLIAEGFENGASAAMAKPGWRIIVTFGSSNFDKQAELLGSGEVVILNDNDAAGSDADKARLAAVAFYQARGRKVRLARPPELPQKPKADLNDILLAHGLDAVRVALDSAPYCMPPNAPRGIPRQSQAERAEALKQFRAGIDGWAAEVAPVALAKSEYRKRRQAAHDALDADMSLTDTERTAAKARVTKALKDEIGRDLLDAEPVRMVEASPAGIGKTVTTLQAIKAQGLDRVSAWFLEPTLALAAEAADKAAAMGLKVEVVRGRLAEGNPVMCHRPKLVEDAQTAGITNIQAALCQSGARRCPYFDTCGYQAQRSRMMADQERIAFAATSYLTTPAAFMGRPDIVIVDEKHFDQVAGRIDLVPADITDATLAWQKAGVDHAADYADMAARLVPALTAGKPILAALRGAGIDRAALGDGIEYLAAVGDEITEAIHPEMDAAEIARALRDFKASTLGKVRGLLRALLDEIDLPRDECNAVSVATVNDAPAIFTHYKRQITVPDDSAVLLLDASENPTITQAIWGPMRRQAVAIERNAHVTQVVGRNMSKATLTGKRGKRAGLKEPADISPDRAEEAERITADLCRMIRHTPGRVLAIGQKDLVNSWELTPRPKGQPPVMRAWFNGMRGLDGFKDCETVFVAGRVLPPVWAMEGIARALWATDDSAIISAGNYVEVTRDLQMRDGSKVQVQEPAHPDSRVQAVLCQTMKEEILQGLDRLRLIHAPTPKRVYIVNQIALPGLVVDEVEQFRTWRQAGSRIERAADTLTVIPLTPGKMAELFPHIWASDRTAKRDLAEIREAISGAENNGAKVHREYSYMENGPIYLAPETPAFQLVSYRLPGQRGNDAKALVRADIRDKAEALAAWVGELAAFAVEGQAPAAIPEAVPAAAGADLGERLAFLTVESGLTEPEALAVVRFEHQQAMRAGQAPP